MDEDLIEVKFSAEYYSTRNPLFILPIFVFGGANMVNIVIQTSHNVFIFSFTEIDEESK